MNTYILNIPEGISLDEVEIINTLYKMLILYIIILLMYAGI